MAIPSLYPSFSATPTAKPAAPQASSRVANSSDAAEQSPTEASVSRQEVANRAQIDQAMEKMHDALPAVARNLQFSLDEATGQSVVKVVDSTTNEVIRQMPSEELLAIAKALDKFTGLLLKQKA